MLRTAFTLGVALVLLDGDDSTLQSDSLCPDGAVLQGGTPPSNLHWECVLHSQYGAADRHGWSVEYWPSGNKKAACEFRYNILDGRCSTWNQLGQLESRGMFDKGVHTGYWWYWGLLEQMLYVSDAAVARESTEKFLSERGISDDDVRPLTEFIIKHHTDHNTDIRAAPQLCAQSGCVSAATIDGRSVLAVQFGPPASKVSTPDPQLPTYVKAAAATHKLIDRARARREREATKADDDYESEVRRWDNTSLQCNDGTRSPSCVCGGGHQGCCSHHGGVRGCPRDYPQRPELDTEPLIPNPLLNSD